MNNENLLIDIKDLLNAMASTVDDIAYFNEHKNEIPLSIYAELISPDQMPLARLKQLTEKFDALVGRLS